MEKGLKAGTHNKKLINWEAFCHFGSDKACWKFVCFFCVFLTFFSVTQDRWRNKIWQNYIIHFVRVCSWNPLLCHVSYSFESIVYCVDTGRKFKRRHNRHCLFQNYKYLNEELLLPQINSSSKATIQLPWMIHYHLPVYTLWLEPAAWSISGDDQSIIVNKIKMIRKMTARSTLKCSAQALRRAWMMMNLSLTKYQPTGFRLSYPKRYVFQ